MARGGGSDLIDAFNATSSIGGRLVDAYQGQKQLELNKRSLDISEEDRKLQRQLQAAELVARRQALEEQAAARNFERQKSLYGMAQELSGYSPERTSQYNAITGKFGIPSLPMMSNANVKIDNKGIQYQGTVKDAMVDSQNPAIAPLFNASLQKTLGGVGSFGAGASQASAPSSQQPSAPYSSQGIPLTPELLAVAEEQRKKRALDLAAKQSEIDNAAADAKAKREKLAADLRLELSKLTPEQAQIFNATGQLPQDGGLLPNQIPIPKATKPKLEQADTSMLTNSMQMLRNLDRLEQTMKRSGTTEGVVLPNPGVLIGGAPLRETGVPTPFSNTQDIATLKQLPYEMAIQYAKIVDPSSVAREGEVAAAQKYLLPSGPNVNTGVALDAIKQQRARMLEYIDNFAKIKGINPEELLPDLKQYRTGSSQPSFNSLQEAESANLPRGTIINVGGRRAVVE